MTKPGWRTTEFWVTVATTAWSLFGHTLPPLAQAVVAAVVPAAYSIARAVAKRPVKQ
jgi:hypothetical protein